MLHLSAGVAVDRLHEIHGSLGYLQCASQCCEALYPVDATFHQRLRDEPEWVPRCTACQQSCLRPNVLIFQDDKFVDANERRQRANKDVFNTAVEEGNLAVLEVGAVINSPFIHCDSQMPSWPKDLRQTCVCGRGVWCLRSGPWPSGTRKWAERSSASTHLRWNAARWAPTAAA